MPLLSSFYVDYNLIYEAMYMYMYVKPVRAIAVV